MTMLTSTMAVTTVMNAIRTFAETLQFMNTVTNLNRFTMAIQVAISVLNWKLTEQAKMMTMLWNFSKLATKKMTASTCRTCQLSWMQRENAA